MKQYNSWQGYKRLLTFIKPYKTRLVFAVICMALSGASNVVVPWLIKDVIDKVCPPLLAEGTGEKKSAVKKPKQSA